MAQGVFDTNAEALAYADAAPATSTTGAFAASKDWMAIASVNDPALARMNLSSDTHQRLTASLASNHLVVVPRTVSADGGFRGWWQVDKATGETLGIGDRGWGAGPMSEFAVLLYAGALAFLSSWIFCAAGPGSGSPIVAHDFLPATPHAHGLFDAIEVPVEARSTGCLNQALIAGLVGISFSALGAASGIGGAVGRGGGLPEEPMGPSGSGSGAGSSGATGGGSGGASGSSGPGGSVTGGAGGSGGGTGGASGGGTGGGGTTPSTPNPNPWGPHPEDPNVDWQKFFNDNWPPETPDNPNAFRQKFGYDVPPPNGGSPLAQTVPPPGNVQSPLATTIPPNGNATSPLATTTPGATGGGATVPMGGSPTIPGNGGAAVTPPPGATIPMGNSPTVPGCSAPCTPGGATTLVGLGGAIGALGGS
jgi:hypothetical protein